MSIFKQNLRRARGRAIDLGVRVTPQRLADRFRAEGFSEGFEYGRRAGFQSGKRTGRAEGYADGYSYGHAEGRRLGFSGGFRAGYADGRRRSYPEGYEVGRAQGFLEADEQRPLAKLKRLLEGLPPYTGPARIREDDPPTWGG